MIKNAFDYSPLLMAQNFPDFTVELIDNILQLEYNAVE